MEDCTGIVSNKTVEMNDSEIVSPVYRPIKFYPSDSDEDNIAIDADLKKPPEYEEKESEQEVDEGEFEVEVFDNNVFNHRALSKYATTYELEKFEKNVLIIFNQENIFGYKPRLGTEQDVRELESTFSRFGFEVEIHKDYTREEIFQVLDSFKRRDFTDYGCVAIAVLTHGTRDGILRARDQQLTEFDIIDALKTHNKPTLITKPKLLIIQACRGARDIQGVVVGRSAKIRRDIDDDFNPYTLPVEADMFVLHSSYMGNPSHRDEINGSWLIQTLCHKIKQLSPKHDLEHIIIEVKREVAIDKYHEEYNRRTLEIDTNKQIPVVTSTLIRKLYFKRFGEETNAISHTDSNVVQSRNEVLDASSPVSLEFGPCLCFLDYYAYIKNCLRLFLDKNPEDATAQSFFEISESFDDNFEFNSAKEKMTKAICNHLSIYARDFEFYKYLYIKTTVDRLK
ncbi:caspase-3-like [Zerene cesonia]|uniref:caspase-3-like n=1 Tax=Zerene cesonia TaxID=33412 RepID=UPI0018E592F3|nr:caspase-3-like [Zerene cesonia]